MGSELHPVSYSRKPWSWRSRTARKIRRRLAQRRHDREQGSQPEDADNVYVAVATRMGATWVAKVDGQSEFRIEARWRWQIRAAAKEQLAAVLECEPSDIKIRLTLGAPRVRFGHRVVPKAR